jgi:N-acetylneuraminic acid mutarotase
MTQRHRILHVAGVGLLALTGLGCGSDETKAAPATPARMEAKYPKLPEAIDAFGAALLGGAIYTYGGHLGTTHGFSTDTQSSAFRRLRLKSGSVWEDLGKVEPLESPGLAVHGGVLYRIGGLSATNAGGAPEELHSVKTVRRYDPASAEWSAMPDMPEERSAHGVATIGDKLYVVAGWQLNGDSNSGMFKTGGFALDLGRPSPAWEAIPEPPFKHRSLAVAALGDKIYVLGGATEVASEFSDQVYVLDTKAGAWKEGPKLETRTPLKAFGAAACSVGGHLYVNYSDGLFRLNEAANGWESVGPMKTPRIFNALICASESELIAVGGVLVSDQSRTPDVESIHVGTMTAAAK